MGFLSKIFRVFDSNYTERYTATGIPRVGNKEPVFPYCSSIWIRCLDERKNVLAVANLYLSELALMRE